MTTIERDYQAYLDEMNVITILIPHDYNHDVMSSFLLECDDEEIPLMIVEKIDLDEFVKYVCHTQEEVRIGRHYWVKDALQRKTDLQMGAVTRTDRFDETFYYDGELGVCYQPNETIFTLWAPTATEVKLKLTSPDESNQETIDLIKGDKGIWTAIVKRDVEKFRYTYLVCVNLQWKEAVDPYAVAVTANGTEGVVIDLTKTTFPKRPLSPLEHAVDSVIYETHIRDLTIHPNSGVLHKGMYTGAAEIDTKGSNGSPTSLSYIKSLGITHIEFLPLYDFVGVDELGEKNDYNWGYNPLHYNVPDGSYSLDPNDPYKRINELKSLIDTLHQNEIRVILDVVYNHVYERETSSFEKIIPGYYFRHDKHGMPSNGTGVGNDIASEKKMVRKFIVDSVLYWLKEYDVDGFRFDLMGILDTVTMKEIRNVVDQIDPSILIIGEGWDLNTPLPLEKKANIHNQTDLPRIGQFNDWFRDCIKGSTFNLYDLGYAFGNEHYYGSAIQVIAGSVGLGNPAEGLFDEPNQSVNYVESHDNHTLWDKLVVCFPDEEEEIRKKYHRLATTMVILAQGTPFLHSGQEFFRTKKGIGNSYQSPNEINQLDWDRKNEYDQHVEYVKGIIAIRKSHRAFRLPTAALIRKHIRFLPLKKPLIGWILQDVGKYGPCQSIIVLINPMKMEEEIDLPDGSWNVLANEDISGVSPIYRVNNHKIRLKAVSSYVLFGE
ncbi:type I pullulanase [Bacillus sp. V3B]|uniref:type I pullulanase n=1 Tax=Bacillus sp. V3B TaxID=2804915 RepID=UPI002108B291|nr:type I pullulanase [Bacillus sp. V3B]MCQ6274432.1 type I pullulanase [Bacillus sp. V3B]